MADFSPLCFIHRAEHGILEFGKPAHTRTQSVDWDPGTIITQLTPLRPGRKRNPMSKMVSFYLEIILWKFCLEDGRNREEGQRDMRNFIALDG